MRTTKFTLLIITMLFVTVACKNETAPEIKTVETVTSKTAVNTALNYNPNASFAKAEFKIEGMTCAIGCAKSIERKLATMEGVKSAEVDFERSLAMVEYDNDKVNTVSLEGTVTNLASMYKVKDMKTVDDFSTAK